MKKEVGVGAGSTTPLGHPQVPQLLTQGGDCNLFQGK
jgi:hypothetical protein